MERLNITITKPLIMAVKAHMKKTGLTFSDIVRQALTAYLKEYAAHEQGRQGRTGGKTT